ncbi:MAG: SCO family protein [Anaerolineae bacterium]|nr:SCO family protein [Anaerolineae bacterium]
MPRFCLQTLAEVTRIYRELGPELSAQVQTVFISVDPERDSLDRLMRYVAGFDERFIGARSEDDTYRTVMQQFGAVAVRQDVDSALGYLMDHTASVFLVDPEGRWLSRYTFGTPYEDILHDVRLVLEAYSA